MPKHKDLKHLTRLRMQKTGESYTAARARLLEKRRTKPQSTAGAVATASAAAPAPANVDFGALAGMTDAAIQAKTGRTWKQWVQALDAVSATKMPHRDIAQHVHDEYEIDGWWAQTVTVGYERIRGLRDIGQRRGGGYEASKSKTYSVPVETLFAAFNDARRRQRWLPETGLRVRKATPPKSVRITWPDGTNVEVNLVAKGESKSVAAVQHSKLGSRADVDRLKKYWNERLSVLADLLVPAPKARR